MLEKENDTCAVCLSCGVKNRLHYGLASGLNNNQYFYQSCLGCGSREISYEEDTENTAPIVDLEDLGHFTVSIEKK